LDIAVRFSEKNATVRYLPGKVRLEQILKQYDDTPFDVAPDGPIVMIVRAKQVTLRGWSQRPQPDKPASKTDPSEKKASKAKSGEESSQPIQLFVELVLTNKIRLASPPQLSLSDPPASGLELADGFQKVELGETPSNDNKEQSGEKARTTRFVARLTESVSRQPGEITVPVNFRVATIGEGEEQQAVEGRVDVVLRTVGVKSSTRLDATTGVALIGGTLELRLGHLCDQKGCVEHFYKSLGEIAGLGAVRPHPSLKHPRASVYMRARQPVDVWSLREKLRDQGVEIASMVPHNLPRYRLRIELPRWQADETSHEVLQCLVCRDRTGELLDKLAWASNIDLAGGGINFEPSNPDVDLAELLDAITDSGTAPLAVWLVPAGVAMPKAAPPQLAQPSVGPKQGGSQIHPLVEFEFGHSSDVGTDILALLEQQKWASLTHFESDSTVTARLAIADRKYANLTPLLHQLRATGRIPRQIRLRGFGDIRIQFEFAHICGDVEYSKPPKPKKKSNKKDAKKKNPDTACSCQTTDKGPDSADAPATKEQPVKADTKKESKPKKPFVPKPLRPASTSNGRRAIEAAVASVGWIKNAVFHDYHTKPQFKGPRKLMIALQVKGDDVVRLEQLIQALRGAGFPPKSVIVSRRFSGIPFAKPLPGDLQLTDRQGKKQSLASLRKAGRPLAFAFVSLKSPRKKKYNADPEHYKSLKQTIDKYRDRIDFLAVSANKDDKFADVVEFWEKTAVATVPLLHDADGTVRAAFNAQATPAPHLFVFDVEGRLRYAGDAYDNWEKPDKPKEFFLEKALELVLARKYQTNGAVFYNKSLCNCSHPKCKCPKCGCGSTCRCAVGNCSVGF